MGSPCPQNVALICGRKVPWQIYRVPYITIWIGTLRFHTYTLYILLYNPQIKRQDSIKMIKKYSQFFLYLLQKQTRQLTAGSRGTHKLTSETLLDVNFELLCYMHSYCKHGCIIMDLHTCHIHVYMAYWEFVVFWSASDFLPLCKTS